MLVSHEIPISVFSIFKRMNDYDYCLLHLTYENEQYKNYYINAVKEGRQVLLDNSLFELGDALTNEQLAEGVKLINPTWYVIPDCLNNKDVTIERFKAFKADYPDLPGKAVGVVQGSTIEDMIECYKFMSEHADKIAIPFDSKAFEEVVDDKDQLFQWCKGRQYFIQLLVRSGIWNHEKPHHLLGCSYAREFSFPLYKNISIESVDTSNPIIAALHGELYKSYGLDYKPSTKLCDLINHEVTFDEFTLMVRNALQFKKICNSEKNWVCFFSQTGSEIYNVSSDIGIDPDLIIVNKSDMSGVNPKLLEKFSDRIVQIPNKPKLDDYLGVIEQYEDIFSNCIITLHGYLRIVPKELCDAYEIYNLHPGLITKYPELKGFNPQERAFNGKYETAGAVIHEVVAEVDAGRIWYSFECPITDKTLDEVYEVLHVNSTRLWVTFLDQEVFS